MIDLIPDALRRYDDDGFTPDNLVRAIDRGGGQTCDIRGVLVALSAAGFAVVNARELVKEK